MLGFPCVTPSHTDGILLPRWALRSPEGSGRAGCSDTLTKTRVSPNGTGLDGNGECTETEAKDRGRCLGLRQHTEGGAVSRRDGIPAVAISRYTCCRYLRMSALTADPEHVPSLFSPQHSFSVRDEVLNFPNAALRINPHDVWKTCGSGVEFLLYSETVEGF